MRGRDEGIHVLLRRLLASRRSVRLFSSRPIRVDDLLFVLWSGYGCVDKYCRRRTSPSAGATYPIELYAAIRRGGVEGLGAGVYLYDGRRDLRLVRGMDVSRSLYEACLRQRWVLDAPVNIIVAARPWRTTRWYGAERGMRYVYMEAGHVGQNIYLAAAALGLGTVAVGAFYDDMVSEIMGFGGEVAPLYVMPLGYPRVKRR